MTDNLPTTTQDPKPARKGRISKRLAKAIQLIITGACSTQKAAAERAGLNESYFSEALQKPHVQVFVARQTRSTIASGQMRAGARLISLIDAGSEHVSLDASKHVLGIAGIKPDADAAVNVNIDLRAGWILDLSERPSESQPRPMVDVTPSRTAPAVTSTFGGSARGCSGSPGPASPPAEPIFQRPKP